MSLELVKETIRVNRVIGIESTQSVLDNDLIVPDIKPDVGSILLLDGDVFVNRSEVVQDKAVVHGTIRYKILYAPEDSNLPMDSIVSSCEFSNEVDMPEVRGGMKAKPKVFIDHLEHHVLNGRKVNVKAIMTTRVRVMEEAPQDILTDIGGGGDFQVMKEKALFNHFLGEGAADINISESLEIPSGKPPIRDVMRSDVKINETDFKVTDGRVIVRGTLGVSTLYSAGDETGSVQFMEHEVPFTQVIDIADVNDTCSCEASCNIKGARYEIGEDSDGEPRILKAEVDLEVSASANTQRSFEVLSDAYGLSTRLGLESSDFLTEEVAADEKAQVNVREVLNIDSGETGVSEVQTVICRPSVTDWEVLDDRIDVEGVVNASMIYRTEDEVQPVKVASQEIPFRQSINIKGIKSGMPGEVDLDLGHMSYSLISSNELEVRLSIGVNAKVYDSPKLSLVSRIVELPADERKLASAPSIIVYFVQPGDSFWGIAKRYMTTVQSILKTNSLSEGDSLAAGQQIIIPRKTS